MGNLTEKEAQRAFGGKIKKSAKPNRLVKYKNSKANPKTQVQNEQIYTKTSPNFVLQ